MFWPHKTNSLFSLYESGWSKAVFVTKCSIHFQRVGMAKQVENYITLFFRFFKFLLVDIRQFFFNVFSNYSKTFIPQDLSFTTIIILPLKNILVWPRNKWMIFEGLNTFCAEWWTQTAHSVLKSSCLIFRYWRQCHA